MPAMPPPKNFGKGRLLVGHPKTYRQTEAERIQTEIRRLNEQIDEMKDRRIELERKLQIAESV